MSSHLLVVTLGPVQEFIQAGRRTRDLWAGSTLLSQISRAAALEIDGHGELIFPGKDGGKIPDCIANVILAVLREGKDPKSVSVGARNAAQEEWTRAARSAVHSEKWGEYRAAMLHEAVFWSQVDDVLEYYAAWTPLTTDYEACRHRLMRLLAGRKNCRNFIQSDFQERNYPKSSLDGLRETVLTRAASTLAKEAGPGEDRVLTRLKRDLRVSAGEELDAVGLTKRLADLEYFPSVARISADPWLRGLAKCAPDGMAQLQQCCKNVNSHSLVRVDWPQFSHFRYDGTVVYRTRHKDISKYGLEEKEHKALIDVRELLRRLKPQFGEPQAYLAVIAADGDRMGKLISDLKSLQLHQEFSKELAKFAAEAKRIVEENFGCRVYAGGDDVLALVPVDRALHAAHALHEEFARTLHRFNAPRPAAEQATLSVGVAIGHFMEPLEDLLRYARDAEKDAKGRERDGLAIWFHPRNGAASGMRGSWKGGFYGLLQKFVEWHLEDRVPDKAAYDLISMASHYDRWPSEPDEEEEKRRNAFTADAARLLAGKRKGASREDHREQLDRLKADLGETTKLFADLGLVPRSLAIARRIAEAVRQARGGKA